MRRRVGLAALIVGSLVSPAAFAGEKTVTLRVQNMYCAACPHTVKASLLAVPGVERVTVSFEKKSATVTYDAAKANVGALTTATRNAGYPSSPKT